MMNRRTRIVSPGRICLIILLVSFISPLTAQEFRFLTFADYYGGIEISEGYENLRSRIYMRPWFSGFSEELNMEWLLSARLWVDPMSEGGASDAVDPWDILEEAYLLFPFPSFEISLGQKLLTYGFADIYGPLNAPHSSFRSVYSLDDPYQSRRADPLVQLKLYPTFEDTISISYIPFTRPDQEQEEDVLLPDTNDRVVWEDAPYLTDMPHSLFLHYSRYGMNADFQLFYGWYVEHTPDFIIPGVDSVATDIGVTYNRKHTFGAAYATRIGNNTLSQDVAFNLTSDLDGSDLGAQNTDLTVNTQFLCNLPGNILSQFSLVYSWFPNHDGHAGTETDTAASLEYLEGEIRNFHNQPYEHIAFMVGHFEKSFLREKLKTQLNLAFFFSPNVYIAPRLAYSITDLWALEFGADITLGDPPDFDLRRNPSDDNFHVRVLYRF